MNPSGILWPIFRQNDDLLHDLPALGATVIEQWVKAKYGVRVLIVVVPHTFGRHLNFDAHLHVMVSAGGLKESGVCWTTPLRFNRSKLMHMWRYAVITYLREALKKGLLVLEASNQELRVMLETQYERWWNVYVDPIKSKWHFLRYVAALRSTTTDCPASIHEDYGQRRPTYLIEEFVDALAAHVPDRYQHAMRRFGLLAPRTQCVTSAALFALLRQKRRPRPQRLNWRNSLHKYFGVDPLVDSRGQAMHWARRLAVCGEVGSPSSKHFSPHSAALRFYSC